MDIKELLPIGSVVLLKKGEKKLMIYGVKQSDTEDVNKEYDYVAVAYPEGNLGPKFQFLFSHEDIAQVFFRGFDDDERAKFIEKLAAVYSAS
ncbi:MAG: DUF4176 domain-containing protein [Oscillospiraceae bacterium]|jgi:hypothetical protein|nr:DUF4176 domain-containing protein [Oscillospiraceae bacterium]